VGPLPWNCFFCFMKFHLPRAFPLPAHV
jgi:hypothetical protein